MLTRHLRLLALAALALGLAGGLLARHQASLRLRGLVYFSRRDLEPYLPPLQDHLGLHTGLLE